jgi:hypothetical protein
MIAPKSMPSAMAPLAATISILPLLNALVIVFPLDISDINE